MTDGYPVVLTFDVPRRFAPLSRLVIDYWQEQELIARANRRGWVLVSREAQFPAHCPGHEEGAT